jgi:hypothetical protein
MRILNRVIAASALVVPMALGASGIAAADVAAGSSVLPTQIAAGEGDHSDDCNDDDGDGLLGGLLGLGGDDDDHDDDHDKCK